MPKTGLQYSKTPDKGTLSLKKQKLFKTVRNILYEKEDLNDHVDSSSENEEQTIGVDNNLKQQEINAKMFEDVKPLRPKNKVKAKAVFANISVKTPSLFWKHDREDMNK
jgi:hypothetical protein